MLLLAKVANKETSGQAQGLDSPTELRATYIMFRCLRTHGMSKSFSLISGTRQGRSDRAVSSFVRRADVASSHTFLESPRCLWFRHTSKTITQSLGSEKYKEKATKNIYSGTSTIDELGSVHSVNSGNGQGSTQHKAKGKAKALRRFVAKTYDISPPSMSCRADGNLEISLLRIEPLFGVFIAFPTDL